MANPLIIDCHMHLYPSQIKANWAKGDYEVWEYGAKDDVNSCKFEGVVDDGLAALEEVRATKAVVVNLFGIDMTRDEAVSQLSGEISPDERIREIEAIDATIGERLKASNEWTSTLTVEHPHLLSFIAADPRALPMQEMCDHIVDQVRNHGAKGVKLHGIVQKFHMNDRIMWPIYRTCVEEGIPIVAHSGPAVGHDQYAEPRAFAEVFEAFPELNIVLAHLGGGAWKQVLDLATAYPQARFDCSEIICWLGAPNAPSEYEIAQLILDIGPERVMMGSDFPWYDIDYTVDRVMSLPLLSAQEIEGMLGANAESIFGL